MAISPVWPISSVWPSGGAETTACVPMRAGRAGAVLDHDVLAERLAERRRDQPRDDVAGAARRIGDDDVDGAVREGLRGRRGGGEREQHSSDAAEANAHFLVSSRNDCQ